MSAFNVPGNSGPGENAGLYHLSALETRRIKPALHPYQCWGLDPARRSLERWVTRREQDVLKQLATGATNPAIAAELQLSERTVAHHVSAILRKLSVHTRGQAATEAARNADAGAPLAYVVPR